jgi:hypothetical protein
MFGITQMSCPVGNVLSGSETCGERSEGATRENSHVHTEQDPYSHTHTPIHSHSHHTTHPHGARGSGMGVEVYIGVGTLEAGEDSGEAALYRQQCVALSRSIQPPDVDEHILPHL